MLFFFFAQIDLNFFTILYFEVIWHLFINLNTKSTDLKSENKLLPVMVFFHGGSWEKGTGAGLNIRDNHIYDGTILGNIGEVRQLMQRACLNIIDFKDRLHRKKLIVAVVNKLTKYPTRVLWSIFVIVKTLSNKLFLRQVIVVSVSYRLGALGFMNDGIDNGVLEGNYGIRDMVLSLQWVQENIDDYAGNNSLVTIFGQSAGSTAVSLLGLSPMTEGLLQGVIAERFLACLILHLSQLYSFILV